MNTPVQTYGQSIRIYLVEGTTGGLTIASIPNWSGSVVVASALDISKLAARPEAERAGCYILLGDDKASTKPRAYVGQARLLRNRVNSHARDKDWWEKVAIISTSDSNFTAGHYLALESRLIQLSKIAERVTLENGNAPDESAGALGEADRADIESFLDKLRILLPVLGFDLIKSKIQKSALEERANQVSSMPSEEFRLVHKLGMSATAIISDGEFVVIAGSTANAEDTFEHNNYHRLRQSLIDDGTLSKSSGSPFYLFVNDTPFKSSSAAAAIVLNRQASGPREWRASNGISLGDWQIMKEAEALSSTSRDEVDDGI